MASNHDFLVIDLEATCDDGVPPLFPREEMETIEIGAVHVCGRTLAPLREFQTFIRPVRHPVLTPFCLSLTSITQEQVDAAPGFREAIDLLRAFMGSTPMFFCSWGKYDKTQLERDAAFHGVDLPFDERHFNIKKAFQTGKRKETVESGLTRLGLIFEGVQHRGIDDARNIARFLPHVTLP